MFTNDLPKELDCQFELFANDILMYQTIECSHDTFLKFQENLTPFSKSVDKWGRDFNVKKSKILLFNHEDKLPHYSLYGHELEIVEEIKYLGEGGHHSVRYEVHCSYLHKSHDCEPATRYDQERTVLGSYQCQTDSL